MIRTSRQELSRTVVYGEDVVAAGRREATEAGITMFERGGNAVDAAVAAAFVACVAEPADATIAGSGFMLVWDPLERRALSIEFPPRAPRGATTDMFSIDSSGSPKTMGLSPVVDDANAEGYAAMGVPAAVAGLCRAHQLLGRLRLDTVIEPAIRLADEGFEADLDFTVHVLNNMATLKRYGEACRIFVPAGHPAAPAVHYRAEPIEVPRIRQPELARSLEMIARLGPEALYGGEIGQRIAVEVQAHGGVLRLDDLRAYEPIVRTPMAIDYRGDRVLFPGSPCGAWTVAQTLSILEHLPADGGADGAHWLIEAARHAFADRYHFLGDPDHGPVPLDALLSSSYAEMIAERIQNAGASPSLEYGERDDHPWEVFANRAAHRPSDTAISAGHDPASMLPGAAGSGTVHQSTADRSGMAVSCTFTAANAFGSKVIPCGTGVLLDGAMLWFNARPGFVNSIAPWKRPLVNMAPMLVLDGDRVRLAVGAPGGRRVTCAVVQAVRNAVDFGMSVQDAVSAPRIDASESHVIASSRIDPDVLESLKRRGHELRMVDDEQQYLGYDFARPVGTGFTRDGRATGGVDAATPGQVAARLADPVPR